jgi:small basic protein (TIGR04137 family)
MSLDRSLKSGNSLIRHRNVLTRAERLDKLKEEEKWTDKKSVFGLPKVGHRKQEEIKTVKEETEAAPGAVPAAGAAPAAAGAAKGAAPAAGGKAPAAAAGKGAAPTGKGAAPAAKAPAAPAAKKK